LFCAALEVPRANETTCPKEQPAQPATGANTLACGIPDCSGGKTSNREQPQNNSQPVSASLTTFLFMEASVETI
jgi:hypothetical protein